MKNQGRIAKAKSSTTNNARFQVSPKVGRGDLFVLTSNCQAKLGEIKPALSWQSWIPSLLDWDTLYDDPNGGEQCDDSGRYNERPDDTNLDLVSDDAEEEDAYGTLADANDHETCHLTKDFPLDGLEIDGWITDLLEQSS